MIDQFTSTGSKFAFHEDKLRSHVEGEGNSVISTHVAPEGICNLTCEYCSVRNRKPIRIDLGTIKQYIQDLCSRGLKAVIITGGGEPMAYPHIEHLSAYLVAMELEVGLITNGTLFNKVSDETLKEFSWIRVSINKFDNFRTRIKPPSAEVRDNVTFGLSMLYDPEIGHDVKLLKWADQKREEWGAEYLRVVTDCMARGSLYDLKWMNTKIVVEESFDPDKVFFQGRQHRSPSVSKCRMGYFRPYLSEAVHPETNEPGSVFPCDSIPLHHSQGYFNPHWSLCPPHKILDYLDGKIENKFCPSECEGCLFTPHVELIDRYVKSKELPSPGSYEHVNFV